MHRSVRPNDVKKDDYWEDVDVVEHVGSAVSRGLWVSEPLAKDS